ncbi:hypothetical protein [Microcoleus sp. herbarium14]
MGRKLVKSGFLGTAEMPVRQEEGEGGAQKGVFFDWRSLLPP